MAAPLQLFYRHYRRRDHVSAQYDIVETIGPRADEYLYRMMVESLRVRRAWKPLKKVSFGTGRRDFVDIYRPEGTQTRPTVVFFRGGFRTSFDLRQFSFIVEPFLQDGHAAVLVNFDAFVMDAYGATREQIGQALRFLRFAGPHLGFDGSNLVAIGHCTGGMMAGRGVLDCLNWGDAPEFRAWIGLSGIYEPTFMLFADPRRVIDPEAPERIEQMGFESIPNPVRDYCRAMPPLLTLVGLGDSAEMRWQAHRLGQAAVNQGCHWESVELPEHDHLSILIELANRHAQGYRLIRSFLDRQGC